MTPELPREALEAEVLRLRAVINELQARVSGGKDYLGPALCVCGRREDGHVTGWRRDCDVHGEPSVTMPPGWLSLDCPGCTAAAVRSERLRAGAADQLRRADEAWRLLWAALDLLRAEVPPGEMRALVEQRASDRDRAERDVVRVEAENHGLRHGILDLAFELRYGLPPQAHALGRPAGPPLTLDAVRALLEALASGAGRAGERAAKRVETKQLEAPLA